MEDNAYYGRNANHALPYHKFVRVFVLHMPISVKLAFETLNFSRHRKVYIMITSPCQDEAGDHKFSVM